LPAPVPLGELFHVFPHRLTKENDAGDQPP
jgi:hypothetical protein